MIDPLLIETQVVAAVPRMPTVFQLSTISTSDAGNTAVSGLPADGSPLLASVPPMPTPSQSAALQPLANRH